MTTNPVDDRIPQITLGWRLQMALAQGDLSVQEMADNLGVSRSTISRWLHDDGMPPRAAFVKQWALASRVSLEWLQTGKTPVGDGGPAGGEKLPRLDSNQEPTGYTLTLVRAA